jgi:hypothetical protein
LFTHFYIAEMGRSTVTFYLFFSR